MTGSTAAPAEPLLRLRPLGLGEILDDVLRDQGRAVTRPALRLDPRLHRFVQAYAQRRPGLTPQRRAQLAGDVEPALHAALPDLVRSAGPLAALDLLADRELS